MNDADADGSRTWRWWRSWPGFCIGVGVLFFLRGLVVVGFSPPFEGFDEPMHVAYLVHLDEVGTLPEFGKTLVPQSLYEEVVAYPHPKVSMPVVGRLGGATYATFYENSPRLISREPIPLYQAQHPPLYYLAHQALFAWLRHGFGLVAAIGILRVLNLAFAAAAVTLFVLPFRRIIRCPGAARLGALAIGLFPMAVIYVARVGNDALAMLFFAAAFALLAGIEGEHRLWARSAAAGVLVGVGTLTKVIAFLMLPAAAAYLLWLAILKQISWRNLCVAVVLLFSGYLLVCGHHHVVNLQHFGTLFSEAGTVINQGDDGGTAGVLGNIRLHHLWEFFLVHLIKDNLWMSGWSYLPPHPVLEWIWVGLLLVCLFGAVPLSRQILRGEAKLVDPPQRLGIFCLLIVGAVFAGTYAHALNSISAWDGITTPQYYTVAGYPALLTLALLLLGAYRRPGFFVAVAGSLAGLFAVTEVVSLVGRSLPHWAHSRMPVEIIQRLGTLHWVFPSPGSAIAAALLAVLVLVGLLREVAAHTPRGTHAQADG